VTDPSQAAIDRGHELLCERYPSGELEVVSFRGVEQLSRPYSFDVLVFAADVDEATLERDLLGQRVTLWVSSAYAGRRPVRGIVRRIEAEGLSGGGDAHRHRVSLVPRLWLLGRGRASRIFQDESVPRIVSLVLRERGVRVVERLRSTYAPRPYCVQYHESDLAFVRRLLAEEGISYAFEHDDEHDEEAVVLFDDASLLSPIGARLGLDAGAAPPSRLPFRDSPGMSTDLPAVHRFAFVRRLAVGAHGSFELDFRRPSLALTGEARVEAVRDGFDEATLRDYDHVSGPEYGARAEPSAHELGPTDDHVASRRLEQLRRRAALARGESRAAGLAPGRWLELEGAALAAHDGRYTLVRVEHTGFRPGAAAPHAGESRATYEASFVCAPAAITPRPARPTRRVQQVMETATVTGPAGQEIHTDEHGRVRVRFHWDRGARASAHSSCWIRTVQAWAGAGWGFQFVPRVGMEVMVVFQGGDADRPVVVGALHDAEHPPTFPLPANKTRSGIRTQSSRGGDGHNELSFEDRAGFEQVYVHAQRNHDVVVRRDQTTRVGNNRTEQVTQNRFTVVGGSDLKTIGGDLTEAVAGDVSRAVDGTLTTRVEGNRVELVRGRAEVTLDEALSARVAGPSEVRLDTDLVARVEGSSTVVVGRHGDETAHVVHVEGVTELSSTLGAELSSKTSLVLRCGESTIRLLPDAIELSAPRVSLKSASGRVEVAGDELRLEACGPVRLASDQRVELVGGASALRLSEVARLESDAIELVKKPAQVAREEGEASQLTSLELVDDAGRPMPHQRFVVTTWAGEKRLGVLDGAGRAELELDEMATITFPDVLDVRRED
jgi:type VI secretion system secreted protein VgrG